MVIGQALQSYNASGTGKIIVFVRPFFYDAGVAIDTDGNVAVQHDTASTSLVAQTSSAAYLINQKGSGNILQLQSDGEDRLLVKNDGSIAINTKVSDDTATIFAVNNNNSNNAQILAVNGRGDLSFSGVITVEADNFAGSIATDVDGIAEVDFGYDLGSGKPVVELTSEGDTPVFSQVAGWKQDSQNNYTGFKIKTFNISGTGTSAVVHYFVVRKEGDYITKGTLQVTAPSSLTATVIDSGATSSDSSSSNPPSITADGGTPQNAVAPTTDSTSSPQATPTDTSAPVDASTTTPTTESTSPSTTSSEPSSSPQTTPADTATPLPVDTTAPTN